MIWWSPSDESADGGPCLGNLGAPCVTESHSCYSTRSAANLEALPMGVSVQTCCRTCHPTAI